jgi:hypothetical protein
MPSGIYKRSEQHKKNISLALSGKNKSEEHILHMSIAMKGHEQSPETIAKRTASMIRLYKEHPELIKKRNLAIQNGAKKGVESKSWKGDDANYHSKHVYIYRKLGQPCFCSNCKTNDKKKNYEWANISGKYKRDLSDWIRLCIPCHRNYDLGKITLTN